MKLLITTSGDSLSSSIDSRFGRASRFLIYDTENKNIEVIDNQQNLEAAQGAGVQAANNVVQFGADCVITGHCGPKAYKVLQAAGVKIFHTSVEFVFDAIKQFEQGDLQEAEGANSEGHWV